MRVDGCRGSHGEGISRQAVRHVEYDDRRGKREVAALSTCPSWPNYYNRHNEGAIVTRSVVIMSPEMTSSSHREYAVCALLDTIDGIYQDDRPRFTSLPRFRCLRFRAGRVDTRNRGFRLSLSGIDVPRRLRRRLIGFGRSIRQPGNRPGRRQPYTVSSGLFSFRSPTARYGIL